MNVAEWSIRNSVITWVLTILLAVIGAKSFFNLSWLEDPEFTIKEAIVLTSYPGASAAEVEAEVTNVIEKAIQEMGQLKYIESRSSRGVSQIKVVIKDQYDKNRLPQVWDELRRKVNDYQRSLPPGAGPSIVNDDFGDVYGIYLAISGEGYSYKEIYEYAKLLQRELLHAEDVKRIDFYGVQPEVIYVEMRREKMAELGISQDDIYRALAAKNLPAPSGNIKLGPEYIAVNPTGEFKSEKEFGELLIRSRGSASNRLIYLYDVAEIKRGYQEPADTYLRFNRKPAIGLGISTVLGGNVVSMGESLIEKYEALITQAPLGIEIDLIAVQTTAVKASIQGFLVNLMEAVAIVVVILLLFMGLRSGIIIGAVLLVTILGTFVFMDIMDVTLERISLGALVIALGMLVDNAIVVTDGMRVKMQQGIDATTAARDTVGQVGTPLLGATVIAILAFAAIGTSEDSTGEYTRTLFSVIMISLLLSWVTAVTTTPVLCKAFLMPKSKSSGQEAPKDPYAGIIFTLYRGFLSTSIRFRWITTAVVVVLFVSAVVGFGSVKQSFFPDATRPQFYIDYWFPEGTYIDNTVMEMEKAEEYLLKQGGVKNVSTHVGGNQVRFLLTYTPEYAYQSFAQTIIDVDDYRQIDTMMAKFQDDLELLFPQATINTRAFLLGPSSGGKLQLRINGPDPEIIRQLGTKAEDILSADPVSKGVRSEWRSMVKVIRPQMAEAQSRRAGIDRPDLAAALEAAVEGVRVGVYRERDELLPIIARSPKSERADLSSVNAIQIWSPAAQGMIPVGQIVTNFNTEFENPYIWRRDRTTMLKIHADAREGLPSELFERVKVKIEKSLGVDVEQVVGMPIDPEQWNSATIKVKDSDILPLKGMPGYSMAWGGEAEDSARATASIAGYIPIFFGLMVLMVVIIFNSIKKTLVIWLTVPMAIIGVTVGLLLFKQPFGFMAMLGLMSLAGMLIKNAIVLVDQIDLEITSGKESFKAIVDSGVSRLMPVAMAASTTILGMIPLLGDAFFIAMAVTIMFGLGFATVLTLIVVPVFYAIFYRVPNPA